MSTLAKVKPETLTSRCWFAQDKPWVALTDGREVGVPLSFYPTLALAAPQVREQWRLIGAGEGISWEAIDYDLSAEGIVEGWPEHQSSPPVQLPVGGEQAVTRARSALHVRYRPGTDPHWVVLGNDGVVLCERAEQDHAYQAALELARQRDMRYVHVYDEDGRLLRSHPIGMIWGEASDNTR